MMYGMICLSQVKENLVSVTENLQAESERLNVHNDAVSQW